MSRAGLRSVDFLYEHYSFIYISNGLCRSSSLSKSSDGGNGFIAKHAHILFADIVESSEISSMWDILHSNLEATLFSFGLHVLNRWLANLLVSQIYYNQYD